MADILIRFGQNVRYYRRKQKISQESFAKLAHLHRTYISQIEIGKRNVALRNVVKIAKALGVSPKDLI